MSIVEQYLLKLKTEKRRWWRAVAILIALSFLVALATSWNLRLTGITIANGAACGFEEHIHSDECPSEMELICGFVSNENTETNVSQTLDEVSGSDDSSTETLESEAEPPDGEVGSTGGTADQTEVFLDPTESDTELSESEAAPAISDTTTTESVTEPAESDTATTESVSGPAESDTATTESVTEPAISDTATTESVTEPAISDTATTESVTEPAESDTATTESAAETVGSVSVHVHTEACYKIVYQCGIHEHIHSVSCFSDTTADVETSEQWEKTLPELTGQLSQDIVLIAQSQLGVGESERNFELSDDGESRNGITRYGQWYGNLYGEWSNMFTSFCIRYAGLEGVTLNSGAEVMRDGWEEIGRYRSAENYESAPGDIVFLDKNGNGKVETTAIVVSRENQVLTVIEGDVENAVAEVTYPVDGGEIIGYGITAPKRVMMFAAAPVADGNLIANAVTFSKQLLDAGGNFIIYTGPVNGKYYAIDGNGNAVEVQIDDSGAIYSTTTDLNMITWEISIDPQEQFDGRPTYLIRNLSTGRYVHPYDGVTSSGSWGSAMYTSGSGVKMRAARQNTYAYYSGSRFTTTNTQNNATVFNFGKLPRGCTVWLDGTCGNIMDNRGSQNTRYTYPEGSVVKLPSEWKSPTKYAYKLNGWVNIETGDYYMPGQEIKITDDMVLYADWVASTYDIGQYNSYVANTVSTNDFITTRLFDYSALINLLSTKVSVNISENSHSETWSHVANGNVNYKNSPTLNFSFNDHDSGGTLTNLNNLNDPNKYTGGTSVYSGIYNDTLRDALFSVDNLFDPQTGEGIVGKHYLGEGDHLFQINSDPTSEYYGYYYYDAKLNAASYNQTDQRFYVYDYLSRSSDSSGNNDEGKYSDFLPLNSPYANTNGQTVNTYNYGGDNGEYSGVTHYQYDARYDSDGSSSSHNKANLWFGMSVDVRFGLPDTPGERLPNGEYGNKDIYGNDMHFKFTGDDDVWILVDGKVVLDLGGIHQAAEGDINFSTGEVRVNGSSVASISGIDSGEHVLTVLYLERGSSMSNCAIYFNLAPRFALTLQKEDVLTQEILDGAMFEFYKDRACTIPCELWTSKLSYNNGDEPTNLFVIKNGTADIWGLSPSQTYYVREVKPPDSEGYLPAKGIIRLTLDNDGVAAGSIEIIEDTDENGNSIPISNGFTVHGYDIDDETQHAYLTITNAQEWVTETTSVFAQKFWNDTKDHTYDSVTLYLNVTDPDGTVRRIREIRLSEANNWKYTWINLPKYLSDGVTEVQYSVSEAYFQGYMSTIEQIQSGSIVKETWVESQSFKNGGVYVLKTANGCLSAVNSTSQTLCYVDEETAKKSSLALWTATVSGNNIKLVNGNGQILTFNSSNNSLRFYLNKQSANYQTFYTSNTPANASFSGIRICYDLKTSNGWWGSTTTTYYLGSLNSSGYGNATTTENSALAIKALTKTTEELEFEIDGYGYMVTNTELERETSLQVKKNWDHPTGNVGLYEREQVTIKLFANGVDTGRTVTLSLKNGWTDTFMGLPYEGDDGEVIVYTVEESWDNIDWIPIYGEITVLNGETPTYKTTVTNHYRWEGGLPLPSTGGVGSHIYILCGLALILAPLVYGFRLRRRNERRSKN